MTTTADSGRRGGEEVPARSVTVHFRGGPWDGERVQVERVVGPVFNVGVEPGNRYWLDTKSDPPTYHWNPDA